MLVPQFGPASPEPVRAPQPRVVPARVVIRGNVVQGLNLDFSPYRAATAIERPFVSCLMVTKGRAALALRAVELFRRQSHAARELVIVDDDPDDTLAQAVEALKDSTIRLVRLKAENQPLGVLRNIAVDEARGAYVAQWDDDDLHDPERLEVQMAAIAVLGVDAATLSRWRLFWPERRRLGISVSRFWEGSLVCDRTKMPRFPPLRRGEDTPVMVKVASRLRVALLDAPDLYTYILRSSDPGLVEHFERHWRGATRRLEGDACAAPLRALEARHGVDLGAATWSSARASDEVDSTSPRPVHAASDVARAVTTDQAVPRDGGPAAGPPPLILILTPVKDGALALPRYFELLASLTYPADRLALGLLVSDSEDHSLEVIESHLPSLTKQFRRAEVFRRDFGFRPELPRWDPRIQRRRREILARSRNILLSRALRDEAYVLWIDVDLESFPKDVIERLLAPRKDIVAAHCVFEPGGTTFDLNTFRVDEDATARDDEAFVVDGILQPPRGLGRIYLESLRDQPLVEVDAVGGAMLLVRADCHREGLIFPAAPYKRYIETEGLAILARDMGWTSFALPGLEVVHPRR